MAGRRQALPQLADHPFLADDSMETMPVVREGRDRPCSASPIRRGLRTSAARNQNGRIR